MKSLRRDVRLKLWLRQHADDPLPREYNPQLYILSEWEPDAEHNSDEVESM